MQFDPRVLSLLPEPMIIQHKVIPVGFLNNRLSLAMVNPNNIIALDDVRRVDQGSDDRARGDYGRGLQASS
jgi:hypothetical protein